MGDQCASGSQTNGVDGSPKLDELDAPGLAPYLTVKKSVTESVFCIWVATVMCFFPTALLFKACSPMLDSEKAFVHSFHFAFVLSSSTDVKQALYRSFDIQSW